MAIESISKVKNRRLHTEETVTISTASVSDIEKWWSDTLVHNTRILDSFTEATHAHRLLSEHTHYFKRNDYATTKGFGIEALHYMWVLLVNDVHAKFGRVKFLDIGVFKGQTLSLIPAICNWKKYECEFVGVTPLTNQGDKYSNYPRCNYEEEIVHNSAKFGVSVKPNNLIKGLSGMVQNTIRGRGPFNLIFIDGSHDYHDVISDIQLSKDIVEVGGYIVVDDASCNLDMPDKFYSGGNRVSRWGWEDVSRAVEEELVTDTRYKEVFAVGHDRIFRRVS